MGVGVADARCQRGHHHSETTVVDNGSGWSTTLSLSLNYVCAKTRCKFGAVGVGEAAVSGPRPPFTTVQQVRAERPILLLLSHRGDEMVGLESGHKDVEYPQGDQEAGGDYLGRPGTAELTSNLGVSPNHHDGDGHKGFHAEQRH